jgi:hypothetical protein
MLADSAGDAASDSTSTPHQTVRADFPHTASRCPSGAALCRPRMQPPPCRLEDVTSPDPIQQGMEAALRGPLGRDPESALPLAHFVDHRVTGVIGPSGHALARPSAADLITAGALPSRDVVRRRDRQYYDPLRLPLRPRAISPSAYTHDVAPTPGCADGSLVFRSPPCPRAAPLTPPRSLAPVSGRRREGHGLRRDTTGSALGL